jgi:lactate 2-monooxygenase
MSTVTLPGRWSCIRRHRDGFGREQQCVLYRSLRGSYAGTPARQIEYGCAALGILPAVVEAADGLPVLFDSGIRSGADIIKALALGATAVGIGRPYAYGLALGGLDGSVHVLRMLLAEADLTMAVDGYPTLKDLTPEALRPVG